MKESEWSWLDVAKLVIAVIAVCFFVFGGRMDIRHGDMGQKPDTIYTVYVDTIPYYKPIPKDSVVIRYVTQRLPVVFGKEDNFPTKDNNDEQNIPQDGNNMAENIPDSANVEIPIMQKVYKDSTYTAYISGYKPNLDSLFVYPRTNVVQIREKPKRWSVGIGAGYGICKDGFTPCISVCIQYKLWEF